MHDFTAEIQAAVRQLKAERDTWQAVALRYKDAFEVQTNRLQELQDICFAAQAELENDRSQRRGLQSLADRSSIDCLSTNDGEEDVKYSSSFGTAVVFPQAERRRASNACVNPLFHRIQQCIDQRNYGTALAEMERLLRGPLSPKARAEALLLKSTVLQAAGPDDLYDALAACSEALELCDRISDLQTFLPQIQHQRGVLYHQLHTLYQARDTRSTVSDDNALYANAKEYRRLCTDEIDMQRASNRRSGFDENRLFDEGILVKLDDKVDVNCS